MVFARHGCGSRRRSLRRFGLPARSCSCRIRGSPKLAGDVVKRATWPKGVRVPGVIIVRPLVTWHRTVSMIPCVGYACSPIITCPNVHISFLAPTWRRIRIQYRHLMLMWLIRTGLLVRPLPPSCRPTAEETEGGREPDQVNHPRGEPRGFS